MGAGRLGQKRYVSPIETLIAAVLKSNGDGLIMHVGERPYVLSPTGTANLSERPLTVEAMKDVLSDVLSADDQHTLADVGAVEREVVPQAPQGDRFLLVAARGGDDIWIELRRRRGVTATPPARPDEPLAQDVAHRPRMAPSHPLPPSLSAPYRASAPGTPAGDAPTTPASLRRTVAARDSHSGLTLPLSRGPIRSDPPRAGATPSPKYLGIGRLLRTAAARSASSLYLTADARPSIRIDDEILPLETEPPLGKAEVEALILELAPGPSREAFAGGTSAEWVCELPDVGRVRCVSFRDQRGPGAVFRLIPTRLISADQLGLSRDIQALCGEREGLILVAGPRLSGKSTLISAFVDLINRARSDYVITLETEIKFVHENRRAMVSQREVRGEPDAMLAGVRAALRENPDVLVVDDLRTPEVVALALDAAESGHLVIGSVTAHTTSAAIGRLIETAPFERQTQVALSLSEGLRGAVAQVLLRKTGGGRVAARELLFNMPSVAALVAEGKIGQLPLAIDSGRNYGMVPMNDVLLAFVQSGAVEAREAYRKAYDRVAFLELMRREGIDISFVERLA